MVANRTLHGLDNIAAVIAVDERQHALSLMFSIALLLEQAFQELAGNLSEFTESLPQFL